MHNYIASIDFFIADFLGVNFCGRIDTSLFNSFAIISSFQSVICQRGWEGAKSNLKIFGMSPFWSKQIPSQCTFIDSLYGP